MGYERYPRGSQSQYDPSQYDRQQDDPYGRRDAQGYGRADRHSGTGDFDRDRPAYGQRDDGRQGYDRDRQGYGDRGYRSGAYGARDDADRGQRYGRTGDQARYARGDEFHGSYASDRGREDRHDQGRRNDGRQDYGRQPQGYEYDDRGFLARAGDEVRSWFGDEDAERRRELDNRYDERAYNDRDDHYGSWRSTQIAALDRDYAEYRDENRSKFDSEFSTWRSQRQTQRDSLDRVQEHDEVVGSDGSHVGTVDKVRGDRILLTKNDADAGGQHHSIPSRWIESIDAKKVTLSKTADEAKQQWRAEEKNQAMFGYGDNVRGQSAGQNDRGASQSGTYGDAQSSSASSATGGPGSLNRSFSGTY